MGADNKLTVEVTKEMAAMALADAEEAVRDALVAQSDQLLGVTLEAFGTTGNQIKVTATKQDKRSACCNCLRACNSG